MIEIVAGYTSISAGYDVVDAVPRAATGARVTVEFRRERPLAAAEAVRVRYEFAGNGDWREHTGIPQPIRTVVRWGCAVTYHYRLSYWISASAVMERAGGDPHANHPIATVAGAPTITPASAASAGDRFRV